MVVQEECCIDALLNLLVMVARTVLRLGFLKGKVLQLPCRTSIRLQRSQAMPQIVRPA